MVKFLRPYGAYNRGDHATFDSNPEHVQWLLSKNIVEEVPDMPSSGTEKSGEASSPKGKDDAPTKTNPGDPQTRQTTVGPQSRR